MTKYAQLFCTVVDMVSDAQAPGADEARMYKAIREACDYLQKRLGWFIPVIETNRLNGHGKNRLSVPPLLGITSIVNDGDTLTSLDYILKPNNGFWSNGPYTDILVDPDATLLTTWVDEEDGVEIVGPWGKYNLTESTGATVQDTTQQSASQTTLKVENGSKVSPGMVLLIGSEQELVTGWADPTAAITTLNGAVAIGDDIITLTNGALVNIGETLRMNFEQVRVKDKQTHQVYVDRGWNGTGKVAHLTAAAVDVYRTVNVERAVNGTTAAVHANGAAISRYVVPEDVNSLAKQCATLTVNKARGGYQGRTGSEESGVTFYNNEYPEYVIKQVAANYYIPKAR